MDEILEKAKQYLIDHRDELGIKHQNSPPVYRFIVANLPHNEILNDVFFANCTDDIVVLTDYPGDRWVLSQ